MTDTDKALAEIRNALAWLLEAELRRDIHNFWGQSASELVARIFKTGQADK